MPAIILYAIKFSISLSSVFLFYQLFLRRLTFYNWNRWFLIGYSLLSFIIPFINISPIVAEKKLNAIPVFHFIPSLEKYTPSDIITIEKNIPQSFNYWGLLFVVLMLGSLVMLARFLMQFISLQKIKNNSRLLADKETKIYEVKENIIPFSFGNSIFINPKLHTEKEFEEIILHEYVHVKQKHTADIVFSEILCIINWFNPFAWLIRHAVRQNLEFIADHDVLQKGLDKKEYQYHLLKVIGSPQYRIANNFNFSSLKKRIVMMNALKSAKLHLAKFIFLLPLVAILLVAFRDKYAAMFDRKKTATIINEVGIVQDFATRKPIESVRVKDTVSGITAITNKDGFFTMKLPVGKDSVKIFLVFTKEGYKDNLRVRQYATPLLKSHGAVDFCSLVPSHYSGVQSLTFFDVSTGDYPFPDDPTYNEAFQIITNLNNSSRRTRQYAEFQKEHPEITLIYGGDQRKRLILVYKNGMIEKYGYPGGLSFEILKEKFGPVEEFLILDELCREEYLTRWQRISEAAEKQFHTNADVYTTIFPGDSRVVVVPKSGKPQVYDMDNAEPQERPAFEKLYGKLPDVVPPPANASLVDKESVAKKQDTVPTQATTIKKAKNSPGNILYVIDNVIIPKGVDVSYLINPERIESMSVLKGKEAVEKYGIKGTAGVIEISTKKKEADAVPNTGNALIIIDGKENLQTGNLNQYQIESIEVLKDSAAIKKYGKKGRNGVIFIKSRKPETDTSKEHASTRQESMDKNFTKKINQPNFNFLNDTVIGTADTIVYNKTGLRIINGSFRTIKNNNATNINGSITFDADEHSPIIIYNGKEMSAIKNFKTINGHYQLVSLNQQQSEDKYGDKGKNGAIEISSF